MNLKSFEGLTLAFAIMILMLVKSTSVFAASVTVPGFLELTEGRSENGAPFNILLFGYPSMRYQQIYDASEFSVEGIVDAIRFRRDIDSSPFGTPGIDVRIDLAYAATNINTASSTFSNNIGDGLVTVFDDVLTLTGFGSGSPNPFDIVIDVSNQFNYNPSHGDLLLDIYMRNSPLTAQFDAAGSGSFDSEDQEVKMTRIFQTDVSLPTGLIGSNYGLITQFDMVPVPVPAAFWLFSGGLLSLLSVVCRNCPHIKNL